MYRHSAPLSCVWLGRQALPEPGAAPSLEQWASGIEKEQPELGKETDITRAMERLDRIVRTAAEKAGRMFKDAEEGATKGRNSRPMWSAVQSELQHESRPKVGGDSGERLIAEAAPETGAVLRENGREAGAAHRHVPPMFEPFSPFWVRRITKFLAVCA